MLLHLCCLMWMLRIFQSGKIFRIIICMSVYRNIWGRKNIMSTRLSYLSLIAMSAMYPPKKRFVNTSIKESNLGFYQHGWGHKCVNVSLCLQWEKEYGHPPGRPFTSFCLRCELVKSKDHIELCCFWSWFQTTCLDGRPLLWGKGLQFNR